MGERVPAELAKQMGRPISQGAGEMRGFLERARYMLSIAESNLSDIPLEDTDKPGFRRFIKRVPLGVVLVIAPWKSVAPRVNLFSVLNNLQLPVSDRHKFCFSGNYCR
jgi:hypothetical protein